MKSTFLVLFFLICIHPFEAFAAEHTPSKMDVRDAEYYLSLGKKNIQLNKFQEAEDACYQAWKIDVNDSAWECYVRAGSLLKEEKAVDSYRQAIRINPDNFSAYKKLGWSYYMLGKYQEAVDAYKQAIRINPNNWQTHSFIASTYEEMGKYQEAVDAYKQAIIVDPNIKSAYTDLADTYRKFGKDQEAEDVLKQHYKMSTAARHWKISWNKIMSKLNPYVIVGGLILLLITTLLIKLLTRLKERQRDTKEKEPKEVERPFRNWSTEDLQDHIRCAHSDDSLLIVNPEMVPPMKEELRLRQITESDNPTQEINTSTVESKPYDTSTKPDSVSKDETQDDSDTETIQSGIPETYRGLASAIKKWWRDDAHAWWSTSGRQEAYCDSEGESIAQGQGYKTGSRLLCERCTDRRLLESVDWEKAVRDLNKWIGPGVPRHLIDQAEKLWKSPKASSTAKYTMRIGSVFDYGDGVMVAGSLEGQMPSIGDNVEIVGVVGIQKAIIVDSSSVGSRIAYVLEGVKRGSVKEGDILQG